MSLTEPPPGRRSASGHDLTPPDAGTRARLEDALDPEARRVMLAQGTERPFCGGLVDEKRAGVFVCRLCGLPLFDAAAKFESGTGWPSFHSPFDPDHLTQVRDTSHGMVRIEIRCARCDGHLGHVFDDGPRPTGLRYCLNSAALRFIATE